jgi:metal-dependent amidase/aminoacylase/carboxypeptidase family protein
VRGVPPAVNDGECVRLFGEAAELAVGPDAVAQAQQSLGGEDVAWYLESIPGALARLGIRGPQTPTDLDIHQANFDIDERAIGVGVKVMSATALLALSDGHSPQEAVVSSRGTV